MSDITNKSQSNSNSVLSETSIGDDLLATSVTNNKIYASLIQVSSSTLSLPYYSEIGGAEGERKVFDLGTTQGIIDIDYRTNPVPDRLQLIYEDKIIFDTKFISTGTDELRKTEVKFSGNSTQITSVLTANSEIKTTEWNYNLRLRSAPEPLTYSDGTINISAKDAVYEFLSKEVAYRTDLKNGDSLKVLYNGTKFSQITGDYTIDKIFSDGVNTGFYAIGLTSKTQAPVLVLRGTQPTQDNFADLLADVNPKGIGFNQFEQNSVAPLQWLNDISKSTGKSPDITGHSLGGALAQYFAASSKGLGRTLGDVVTFNSPGVAVATVDKFEVGTGSINRIKYYITNGDIVSLGGAKFLPGQYEVLDITNNPIPGIGLYINHVSPVLYPAFYSDGTKLDVKRILESDNTSWLNSDFFTYIDPEFLSTIASAELATQTIPKLQPFQAIPPSLLLRGTVEKNRQAIGQDVEKVSNEIQNLKDGKISINIPNQNLSIPGLKIKVEKLSVDTNGLESLAIRGKVSLPDIFNATADFTGTNYIQVRNTGLEVVGDLSVKDIKIIPKLWEIKDAHLKFDTINETVNASAIVLIPSGILVEGSLGIKSGKLDSIGIFASELNRPIATTGAFLQNIGGDVKNLTNLNLIEFGGDVGITAGGKVDISLPSWLGSNISGSLLSLDVNGQINKDRLTGKGDLSILGGLATGKATATLDWNKNYLYADAKLSFLDGFVSTQASLRTNSNFDISLYGNSEIRIPNASPVLAGKSLASGISRLQYTNNKNSSDDFIAVQGKIDIPFIGLQEVGIQVGFDGGYRWNPGNEVFSPIFQPSSLKVSSLSFDPSSSFQAHLAASAITQPNQYDVQPNTQWLIMNSAWDISSNNPVTVRVKSPSGKAINESDFAANNIAIIKDLTDSRNKSIIINKPLAGSWSMEVVNPTGLDNLQYRAFRDSVAPTIQIASVVDSGNSNFTINYKAIDSDSNAKVSLFYSTDNKSFNGVLIKNDLVENDGIGNHSWNTDGLATGDYYVYAMIADGDSSPVFSYAPGQIKVTESDDLIITKTADKESVAIGGNVTYTMVITNNGKSTSKGVVLTDDLPIGSKLVGSSVSPSQNVDNRLTFDLGNLDKGSSKTVTVTISHQATGDIEQDNKVQTVTSISRVTSRTFDLNVNNNTSIVSTSVIPIPADLSLSGSISPNAGNLGDDVTYNLVISNNGSATATGVFLSDQLPSGLRAKVYQDGEVVSGIKVSTSPDDSYYISSEDNLLVDAYLGDIEPGKNVTVSLTGASITTSDLINNAQVSSNTFETNYANNFITQKIAVKPILPIPVDLELTQSASNTNPKVGDNVTFTLTLTNKSSSIASGIKITDILPAGLSYISSTPNQGSFNSQSGVWDVGNIRDGLVVKLDIVARVTASNGKIINNASITAVSEKDPNINNNLASASITVGSILPVNNTPVASKPLVNASATQDKPFTLALPIGAFTDTDAGDVLTYSATLANGTALPTWLKLDPATGTFTGTPASTNLGNLQVKVTATDKAKAAVSSNFALDVLAPPNNVPVASKPLVNASATQDKPFTLALPVGAFTDTDAGDVLTYSATLANDTPLPAWLKLDATTGTLTGTPASTNLGNLQVKVTASDKAKAMVSNTFALAVLAPVVVNNAPVASKPLVNASATQDKPFTLALPVGAFTDTDAGDVLTYSATLANGTPLPAWLKLDATTGTLTGTPTNTNLGNFQVKVTATDKAKATVSNTFALDVLAPPNNIPVAGKPLVNASATQDKPFTLALPVGAFTDTDAGDVLTYSATLANGTPLPAWLKLDATTGTFTGTPTSTNLGNLQVKVTASDKAKATVSSTFALDVLAPVGIPVTPVVQPFTIQKATTSNIWNVNGSGKVKVSLLGKSTSQLNEIGIFKLDANNKVNGFASGEAGFAKAVLESGSVVFDVLPTRITDGLNLSHSLQVKNGERLGFFLIANGSVEDGLKSNNFSNVTTSADSIDPFITTPLQVKESQGVYTLDWKQADKNLSFNFQVDTTPETSLTSISSQQGQKEGEVLDLRAFTGKNVQATFTLKREAAYNDSVSFYKIDDTLGAITSSNGQKFKPGDSGYVQAALNNAIVGLNLAGKNGETVTVDKVLQGGSFYAPILMSNVSVSNPTGEHIFTPFSLGNADRSDHVRLLGSNTFGFEDLFGGGDKDFNDVIVQASFKTV